MSPPPLKPPQKNFFFKPPVNFGLMNESDRLFQQGMSLLNQGKLQQAREIFEKVVKINHRHFDAFNLLGIIAAQLNEFELAKNLFDKAIKINPNNAAFYCNQANVFKELNELEKAINSYDKAIVSNKEYALAYCNRSIALYELNRYVEALQSSEQAIKIKSDYTEAYYQHGLNLEELKRFVESLASYDKAIELNTNYIDVYYKRGNVLNRLMRFEEALESYNLAIEFNPECDEAYSNRGIVLYELKRFKESLESYDKAIEFNPYDAITYYNRGNLLNELKRFQESLASYDKAIEINPEYAEAYFNKSILLLSLQDFENGWQLYDWRWKSNSHRSLPINTNKPKLINFHNNFDGNKKILIWAEQGVGDQILYSSMLDQLFKIAPSSQIMLDKRLLPLFERSIPQGKYLDKTVATEDIEYDEHLSIADLGKYFRTCSDDFDSSRNYYLKADQSRANEIRGFLIGDKKFLCGVTWNSKVDIKGVEKSIQLTDLLPILSMKHIAFVNLQYGDAQEQLSDFNKKHNSNIQECFSVDNFNDLDGHAALIQACDFVVTISNTSAHISGAIGKETYLMCPAGKGFLWYWSNQLNGKSLWYPSIHIYQQNVMGQWFDVVQRVKFAIEKKINEIE